MQEGGYPVSYCSKFCHNMHVDALAEGDKDQIAMTKLGKKATNAKRYLV